ncbi:hypothetical protein O9992_11140 [Vibrio lentus]|nr:hypothetical protein [Vibrio lentus]
MLSGLLLNFEIVYGSTRQMIHFSVWLPVNVKPSGEAFYYLP